MLLQDQCACNTCNARLDSATNCMLCMQCLARPCPHLQVNAAYQRDSQKPLVLMGEVFLGQSQRHVGLLGPRHIASSCLASCSEGDVTHLHKDGAPVRLQVQCHFVIYQTCVLQLLHGAVHRRQACKEGVQISNSGVEHQQALCGSCGVMCAGASTRSYRMLCTPLPNCKCQLQ